MKLIDIVEGNVVNMDRFRKSPKPAPEPEPEYYDKPTLGPRKMRDKDSPDKLDNELDKRRYLNFLNNQSGNVITDNKLVPYLRSLITDKKDFNKFTRLLLTDMSPLYTIIKEINAMLERANAGQRLVGVSPNAEDWYFK